MLAALAALLLAAASPVAARGTLHADTIDAASLGARKTLVVYLPPSYGTSPRRRYPVVYYLHGLWGDETNWSRMGHLDAAMDSLVASGAPEMIVVMPDGDDGWYTTWRRPSEIGACRADTVRKEPAASYCVPRARYDDYLVHDVVAYIDAHYRTLADARHRGIAGLSMGGFGALSLALLHPEVFSAAASHSGVLSPLYAGPKPFAGTARWAAQPDSLRRFYGGIWPSMAQAFGPDTAGWWASDPARLAGRLAGRLARTRGARMPALFVDVGVDDLFIDQARAFRAALDTLSVPVTYAEWPGAHTWTYWSAHVGQSLAWMAAHLASPPPRRSS